jgi:DNA-binding Lrp family transcriptional regulator
MEVTMKRNTTKPASGQSVDRVLLKVLRKEGDHTIEELATMTGFDWEQVFSAVDRLSRSGTILLTPARPCGYRASLGAR